MAAHNFHHETLPINALPAQSIGVATVNGPGIGAWWVKAGQVTFVLVGGVFATAPVLTINFQGRKIADDNWETIKQWDGTTAFSLVGATGNRYADGGAAENGALYCTVLARTVDAAVYYDFRISIANAAGTALIGVVAILSNLATRPSGAVDETFAMNVAP